MLGLLLLLNLLGIGIPNKVGTSSLGSSKGAGGGGGGDGLIGNGLVLRLVLALLSNCRADGPGLLLLRLSSCTESIISLRVSNIIGLVPLLRTNLSCGKSCAGEATGLPPLLTGVEPPSLCPAAKLDLLLCVI